MAQRVKLSKKKKNGIIKKLADWQWSSITTNILTLIALIFSIYQNNQNNIKNIQNEKDNNRELGRIHNRDSVQSIRDSIRTELLISQYRNQLVEYNTVRKRDSTQLSLFSSQISLLNKSLIAQNKNLDTQNDIFQVQKIVNKPDLNIALSFKRMNNVIDTFKVNPTITVRNNGSSTAYSTYISYIILAINTQTRKEVNSFHAHDTVYELMLGVNEQKEIQDGIEVNFPILGDNESTKFFIKEYINFEKRRKNLIEIYKINPSNNKSKIDTLDQKSYEIMLKKITDFYKYYIIVRIKYRDKFDQENHTYLINEISYNKSGSYLSDGIKLANWPHDVFIVPFDYKDLPVLKDSFIKHGISYNEIANIYKNQKRRNLNTIIK